MLKSKELVAAGVAIMGAAAVIAAACGGGSEDTSPSTTVRPDASGVVQITAKDMRFSPANISVRAGQTVTMRLKNEDSQQHDLQVSGIDVEVMEGGATGTEHQMTPAAGMDMEMTPAAGDMPSGQMTPAAGMDMEMTPAAGDMPSGQMGPIAMHTTPGGEDMMTFVARDPGTYEVWCTMDGHKDAGMVGTLTVE